MAIHFTPAQQKVLDARNHNILVSAAAGSGKTAVLVERIVRLISEGEHPADIDRLLVVTFTRAAAAQMRERVAQALSERLREDPHNEHLQRQEVLLHNAQITTMDSFFTFLLRNYFSDIDLDPGFRQIEPTESRLIAEEVLQDFLEEKYEQKDPAFLACAGYFSPGADDSALEELILELCEKAGSHPSPEAWLRERADDYDVPDEDALFSTPWMRSMVLRTAEQLLESDAGYEAMKAVCRQPGGPDVLLPFFEEEQQGLFEGIRRLVAEAEGRRENSAGQGDTQTGTDKTEAGGNGRREDPDPQTLRALWKEIRASLSRPFARYRTLRGKKYNYIDEDLNKAAKAMRDAEKDRIKKLSDSVGNQSTDMILAVMAAAREPVKTLSALALEYRARFRAVKKERNLIDFVDLEHYALDILAERQEDGSYRAKRAARALRSHYTEILIDEYQDSNEVQELMLKIISGEEDGRRNRFMVGDIKQSIYRFRLARPEIFMEKYDTYRPDDPLTERIELDQNFRSREQVLDCVNALFMRIMRREIGGVDYNETVSLKPGASFPAVSGAASDPEEKDPGEEEPCREDPCREDPYKEVPSGEDPGRENLCGKDPSGENLCKENPYKAEFLFLDIGKKEEGSNVSGGEADSADASEKKRNTPEADETDAGTEEEEGEDYTAVLADEINQLTDRQKEALLIAGRIREMVGVLPVRDEESGQMRPARYGDIVVLLRSTAGWNEDLRAVFERQGIPAYAESRTGYFSAREIRAVIELLRVLDNPRQDIPLYGTLRGFFGGFSEDEIAAVRLTQKDGMLYDALCAAAGEFEPELSVRMENPAGTMPETGGRNPAGTMPGSAQENPSGRTAENPVTPALRDKCAAFVSFVGSWRRRAQVSPVSGIVTALLEETGYLEYCAALPAGAQRTANLRLLRSQADEFTKTDYTGLFQFLRYIDGLHKKEIDYGEANTLDENADVVRIMTIHKSKGLEFPICFVAGLFKQLTFRLFDTSGPVLFDGDWGMGIEYFDPVSRVRATTVRREEIAEKIRRDCMGEELRVLYVAMTRAKEKLILTASTPGFIKKIESWKSRMAGFYHRTGAFRLTPFMIGSATSFAQLICEAVLAAEGPEADLGDTKIFPAEIRFFTTEDLTMQAVEDQMDLSRAEEILRGLEGRPLERQPDPDAARELADRIFRLYPHGELEELVAQTSVSEIKRRAMRTAADGPGESAGESAAELFPDRVPIPCLPSFITRDLRDPQGGAEDTDGTGESRETGETGATGETEATGTTGESGATTDPETGVSADSGVRRGTAFHRALELMDYSLRESFLQEDGTEALRAWIDSLAASSRMTGEEASLVSIPRLRQFLASPLADRMAAADRERRLYREQPFVMGVPARRLDARFPESETVMVQGIIDAFFIRENGIVLIDYKTDRVRAPKELKDRYSAQLALYAEALEKAYSMPVLERIIYSTALAGEVIL